MLQVRVRAPARLHLGFLDLHGGLGRRFGSLGLAIDGVGVRLRLEPSAAPSVTGPSAQRARDYLERAAAALGVPARVRLVVEEAIPEHVGLGSGTQLGLAIAAGMAKLSGRPPAARALAGVVERGARSGIGIGAFEQGGFLVDGGRGAAEAAAPIVARLDFPEDWRLLLLFDEARRGLHGESEAAAFGRLPPFDENLVGRLCRVALMRLLPGIVERDFAAVSAAIGEIQARVGDHFAAAQGGRYASAAVAAALEWLAGQGLTGLGQTSWGPTGFALVDGEASARALARRLEDRFAGRSGLAFRIVRPRNSGAEIAAAPQTAGMDP